MYQSRNRYSIGWDDIYMLRTCNLQHFLDYSFFALVLHTILCRRDITLENPQNDCITCDNLRASSLSFTKGSRWLRPINSCINRGILRGRCPEGALPSCYFLVPSGEESGYTVKITKGLFHYSEHYIVDTFLPPVAKTLLCTMKISEVLHNLFKEKCEREAEEVVSPEL